MYIAKVKIGNIKVGEKVTEKDIGKDYVEQYLSKGYIAKEAEKVKGK